jgi:hypothetical protein
LIDAAVANRGHSRTPKKGPAMSRRFSVQHVAMPPAGWEVRNVKAGTHRVRVAFPPGQGTEGDLGVPVQLLHPRNENPVCCKNPAELLVMGANPLRNSFFGLFGRKKKQSYECGDQVKVRFRYRGMTERIWVRVKNHCGRKYTGILLNDPVVIKKENGDTVHFTGSQIVTD